MRGFVVVFLMAWCLEANSTGAQRWDYLDGRGYVVCDAVLELLNEYNWTREQTMVHAIAVAESYANWKDPPWIELDPLQYEELILELIKYRNVGAEVYFGRKRGRGSAEEDQRRAEIELRQMLKRGLQLRVWRTHLIDWFGDEPAPEGPQTVIQLRTRWDRRLDVGEVDPGKPLIQWWTASFIVADDMKGLEPRVREWVARRINRIKLFRGTPYFIGGVGQTVELLRSFGSGPPAPFCRLEFNYTHGEK